MPAKAGPHYCAQCSRTFARSEHLVRHRRTHTKEKPFECHQCSQSFARSDLLRRHHSKHHNASPGVSHGTPDVPEAQGASSDTPHIDGFAEGAMGVTHSREGSHALQQEHAPTQPDPAIDSIPFDAFDQWPDQTMGGLDVNNTLDAFPFESWASDIPDWILNFSPSGFEHDPNLPAQDAHPSTSLEGSTEGRQSLLSRPSTPPREDSAGSSATRASALPVQHRAFVLSPECHARLQAQIAHVAPGSLPSGSVLSRYIRRFFRSFNRHQPLLHEPTWDHEAAPPSLIFAICANGAVYDLEHVVASRLHEAAVDALQSTVVGLHTLQTYMLCIAFAAWQGTCESTLLAAKLNAAMLPELRRQWASRPLTSRSMLQDWGHWIADESLKRVTCCLFTLNTLMGLAYDHAPAVTLSADTELPAHEEQWAASTPAEWYRSNAPFRAQSRPSFGALEAVLADQSMPLPAHVGIFGCHVLMTKILNRIILLRRSVTTSDSIFRSRQADLMLRLKRWQHMWEAEPQASLSPDNPQGPITFNATAVLRVAYVRLAADFSAVRGSFTFCTDAHQIEPFVNAMPIPSRDEYSTRAALQAALALRIPVKLGIKLISRTSFWVWSIQHALCYFECAIFLSKWLEAIQGAVDLDSGESTVVKVVQGILQDVGGERQCAVDAPSYPELLRSWSTLLNTGDTTVWHLIPKMAKVLELYAHSKTLTADPGSS